MKQGKKQSKFDFETTIIGITWLLVLFMFTVSIVSCDSEPEEPVCIPDEGVFCIDRNQWWGCVGGQWDKTQDYPTYCENDVLYHVGDLGACDEPGSAVKYVCATWICEDNHYYMRYTVDCDPESVLPK